jgi:mannonate dehydratase
MRVTEAEVVVTSPGRNYVTLRLVTDNGLVGLGDATLNGRELAVSAYLTDHLLPLLIGLDAHRIEDTWQFLYRSAYWRRGPVTMTAIAAVDVALWDLKAQSVGLPLYQLLGGACRDGLLAYAHASGADLPSLFDSVRKHVRQGFRAIRAQVGVPGIGTVYGVSTTGDYEPAKRSDFPAEERWDTAAYLRHIPTVFDALRSEFGSELHLLHDAHHRLSPNEAAQLARSLEPYGLFWLEDCTPAENQHALRVVRRHSTTPLAIGEVFNSIWDYNQLIIEQLVDYVRSSVTHAGGITPMRKLLDYADLYQIRSGLHGPSDVSPVGMAAALHLGLAVHNFGIQEFMPHPPEAGEVFETSYRFEAGFLHPSDAPGLGVTLHVERAGRYPYRKAYLPYARLLDGTVHDW